MKYFKNLALALVAFVFVACGSSQSPSEVAKEFAQKFYDNKSETSIEQMMDFLSLKERQEQFKNSNRRYLKLAKDFAKENGGVKEIIIQKEQEKGLITEVSGIIVYENGKKKEYYTWTCKRE